jgi:bacterioferritin-associated ferredoxin
MLICSCRRVSEDVVCAAIREGAGTTAEVIRACGAGSRCGGCTSSIDQLLAATPVLVSH